MRCLKWSITATDNRNAIQLQLFDGNPTKINRSVVDFCLYKLCE